MSKSFTNCPSGSNGGGFQKRAGSSALTFDNLISHTSACGGVRAPKVIRTEVSGLSSSSGANRDVRTSVTKRESSGVGSASSKVVSSRDVSSTLVKDVQGYYTTYAPNGGVVVVPKNTVIKHTWVPLDFTPFGVDGSAKS